MAPADSFGWKNSSHPYGISGYETHVIAKTGEACADGVQEDPPDGLTIDDLKLLAGIIPEGLVPTEACKSQVTYYDYVKDTTHSRVFNGGAIQWSWGLDNTADPIRKITKNVADGLSSTFLGHITQTMTWSGSIYLGGDVTIDSGVTVTIDSGAKIYFFPNNDVERTGGNTNKTELIVKGTLTCVGGTGADSIIFSSASTSPTKGDWGGVFVGHPGRANISFTRFSYADTALSVRDTATVKVRNSTFNYFKTLAVYTTDSKVNLGIAPTDCGKNNILMPTADLAAKAVRSDATPLMKAEGNWWGSAPPDAGWFIGEVDYVPYLSGMANPSSTCPTGGGGGCGGPGNGPCIGKVVAPLPLTFELNQNYPNPFNAGTVIRFALPQPSRVELRIYNILGQAVRTFVDEKPAGVYEVIWDGRDENGIAVSSGIYLYQIRAGEFVESKKMQFIK